MGATRDIALNELPIRGISVNPASTGSAAITVVPSDSGIVFVNKFATTTVYTLPAATDCAGKWFWFFNAQSTATIQITSGTAAVLVGGDHANYDNVIDSDYAGASLLVFGDGSYFYYIDFGSGASWTPQT
jgi:hypothetical protein